MSSLISSSNRSAAAAAVMVSLVNLDGLQECINAAETSNQEQLDTLFRALPKNVQDGVFEMVWVLSGCPSPTSEIDGLRDIAHPEFGRLAFFNDLEGGIDRSIQMPIKHTAMILAFQKIIFTDLKEQTTSKDALALRRRGDFLKQYGHNLGSNLQEEASTKLELLNELCEAAHMTVEILLSTDSNQSKNNQILLYLEKILAYLGIDDREFTSKLNNKPWDPSLFVKKLIERHPKLFDLLVNMHPSFSSFSKISLKKTPYASPMFTHPFTIDAEIKLKSLGIRENKVLIDSILSELATSKARYFLHSGNSHEALAALDVSDTLRECIFRQLWVLAGQPTSENLDPRLTAIAQPEFGEEAFNHEGIIDYFNRTETLDQKLTALQVSEPLNMLLCLEEILRGESKFQFDELFQFHCILPGMISKQLDEIITTSVIDKEKYGTFKGKIAHPDIPADIKLQAVQQSKDEYLQQLANIELCSRVYKTAENREESQKALILGLQIISLSICSGNIYQEAGDDFDIMEKISVFAYKNGASIPYLKLLLGSHVVNAALSHDSKTYGMLQRLQFLKEDTDYPSELDSILVNGQPLKVVSLSVFSSINILRDKFLSVGEGVINREIILFDPESPALKSFYQQEILANESIWKRRNLDKIFQSISAVVHIKFVATQEGNLEEKLDEFVGKWKNERPLSENSACYFQARNGHTVPIIPIGDFIATKRAVCRHLALITGYCIEKLQEDKPESFPAKGRVLHMRSNRDGAGGHAWVWFQTLDGSIYHIDSMARESVLLDGGDEDSYSSQPYIQQLKKRIANLSS